MGGRKRRTLASVGIVTLSWAGPSPTLGAEQPALAAGTRIRVEARGADRENPLDGTLVALDSTKLTLRTELGTAPTIIQRSDVIRIATHSGRHTNAAAAIGALIGAGAAAVFVLRSAGNEGCGGCALPIVILGIPAAAAGAGVGTLVAPDRWTRVPWPDQGALTLADGRPDRSADWSGSRWRGAGGPRVRLLIAAMPQNRYHLGRGGRETRGDRSGQGARAEEPRRAPGQ